MSLTRHKPVTRIEVQPRTQETVLGLSETIEGTKTILFYQVRIEHVKDDVRTLVDNEVVQDKRKSFRHKSLVLDP